MSSTKVLALWPNEKMETLEELSNSHGSAPVIWCRFCSEYLNVSELAWLSSLHVRNDLWAAYKLPAIPKQHRALLLMTFDRAYVTKSNYARADADIRAWLNAFPPDNRVNHWPRIAEIYESNPATPAIGLHCTSVSENPFFGAWNEEAENYKPIDLSMCVDVYAELDAVDDRKAGAK